ncbi:MAG: hypothetical protein LAQ69_21155 [Acidobacteriia bacterium]|nr:hypothetical protein [Terriglobia bacterium]
MHSSVWALLLALSIPAAAADGAAKGWDRIGQTPKTQSVTIHLQDGKTLKGKIQETGSDGLTLIQGSAVRQVKRAEIAKVTRKSRLKGALWGAIAGTAITAPIMAAKAGYIVDKNNPTIKDRLGMAGVAGLFFGGIGAGVGAAAGTSSMIYRAPASVPAKKADLPTAAARKARRLPKDDV